MEIWWQRGIRHALRDEKVLNNISSGFNLCRSNVADHWSESVNPTN